MHLGTTLLQRHRHTIADTAAAPPRYRADAALDAHA
ncbi:hypothetical protein FHR58_001420 [Xanthomonas arboricola]|nr:hypothetical protein [Xanthomonas arboricola]